MHPLLASVDRLALYLAAWVPVALLVTIEFLTVGGLPWGDAAAMALPLCFAYAFVCLAAWYPSQATPLKTSGAIRLFSTHGAAALLSAGVWVILASAWARALRALGFPAAFDRFGQQAPALFVTGVLLFTLSIFAHYLLISYEAARLSETRSLELNVLARDAQLDALRAQVNPHFLFNSLHSIASLIGSDQAGARRMCVLLADFLRETLAMSARDRITLADELALTDHFLAIEQVRFGHRLQVERHVDDAASRCHVPPLLLQPLMENAVTHGIAGLIEGGVIRLDVARRNGQLSIAIENPRDDDAPAKSRRGVGLENVRQRLTAMFGQEARLETRLDPGTFRVELALPLSDD